MHTDHVRRTNIIYCLACSGIIKLIPAILSIKIAGINIKNRQPERLTVGFFVLCSCKRLVKPYSCNIKSLVKSSLALSVFHTGFKGIKVRIS